MSETSTWGPLWSTLAPSCRAWSWGTLTPVCKPPATALGKLLDAKPLSAGDGSWLTAKATLAAVKAFPKLQALKLWSCTAATNAVMAAALQLELIGELAITGKHTEPASSFDCQDAYICSSPKHAAQGAGAAQQQMQHDLRLLRAPSSVLPWHPHLQVIVPPRLYLTDQSIGFEQVLKLIKKRGKVLEVRVALWQLPSHHHPAPGGCLHPVKELSHLFPTVPPCGRLRLARQTSISLAAACTATWAVLETTLILTASGTTVAHSK